jgi:hypothetical protein
MAGVEPPPRCLRLGGVPEGVHDVMWVVMLGLAGQYLDAGVVASGEPQLAIGRRKEGADGRGRLVSQRRRESARTGSCGLGRTGPREQARVRAMSAGTRG